MFCEELCPGTLALSYILLHSCSAGGGQREAAGAVLTLALTTSRSPNSQLHCSNSLVAMQQLLGSNAATP